MGNNEKRFLRYTSIGAFVAFFFLSTPVNSKTYDDILALYRQGDFQDSYHELVILSRKNNAKAFFLLGRMHERGDGVRQDDETAIQFYKKAAGLGLNYASERAEQLSNKDNSVVLEWYLESAWDGDVESEFNLGYLYEMGMGVRINETLAVQWYEEAANQHHADAQLRLGLMLIAGAGIEGDLLSGEQWIIAAANNGSVVAKALNANFIANDNGVDFTQVVRGLRTIEHSSPEFMLHVLESSVRELKKVKTLDLLNEIEPVVQVESPDAPVIPEIVSPAMASTASELLPTDVLNEQPKVILSTSGSISKEIKTIQLLPVTTQLNVNNLIPVNSDKLNLMTQGFNKNAKFVFWLIASFALLVIFAMIISAYIRKRFPGIKSPSIKWPAWINSEPLKLPEFSSNSTSTSSDLDYIQGLWDKEKQNEDEAVRNTVLLSDKSSKIKQDPFETLEAHPDLNPDELDHLPGSVESILAMSSQPIMMERITDIGVDSTSVVVNDSPDVSVDVPSFSPVESIVVESMKPAIILPTIQEITKIDASEFERADVSNIMFNPKLRQTEKISFSRLLPQEVSDIGVEKTQKLNQLSMSNADFLTEIKKSLETTRIAAEKVARRSRLQQKIIRSMVKDKAKNSYVKEQVREYEASRMNDVDAISDARFNLGMMFYQGDGVEKNIQLAIKWLERSAAQGRAEAELKLKELYLKYPEYVVDQDVDESNYAEHHAHVQQARG